MAAKQTEFTIRSLFTMEQFPFSSFTLSNTYITMLNRRQSTVS